MFRKSRRAIVLERKRLRCAAMRAAKERKRLAESSAEPVREARVLGGMLLYGPLAGGPRQDLRLLFDGAHRRLYVSIHGDLPRPTSETALLALVRRELRRVLGGG